MNPFAIATAPDNIRAIVADVSNTVGLSPVPEVLTDYELTELNAYSSVRFTEDGRAVYGVFLPPDPIVRFGGLANLKAAIAHELGHIANEDELSTLKLKRANEYKADDFAATHGFDMSSVLKLAPIQNEVPGDEHPSVTNRLKHLARRASK